MKVLVADDVGYCGGVLRSIAIAEEALSRGLPVFTLGMLIHNERTIAELAAKGIIAVSEEQALTLRDCVLVIRAHGVSERFLSQLHDSVEVVDATCPCVRRLHEIVKQARNENKQLVVVGDAHHPEVRGVILDAEEDAVVIESEEDARRFVPTRDVLMIAQTTCSPEKYQSILNITEISAKNCKKSVAYFSTICYTTTKRREQSMLLASKVDTMLVLGSKRSANSRALVELCRQVCPSVHLIESASDLGKLNKKLISTLGVTTGASTPSALVTEVISLMSSEEKAIVGEEVSVNADVAAEVSSATKPVVSKPMTMAEALESMVEIRTGAKLTCTVIEVRDDGLVVDCGQKKDGFISAENCGLEEYAQDAYNKGDVFVAMVIENKSKDKSMLTLSKRAIDMKDQELAELAEAEKELEGARFDVTINKVVPGGKGLLGNKGNFTIFIPASHVDVEPVTEEDLNKYVGQTLTVKKLPPKKDEPERKNSKRLVASHKMVIIGDRKAAAYAAKKAQAARRAAEAQQKLDTFEANKDRFEVNNIVPGTVKKFMSFGVFVNVYGFDCLCPTSEISWVRSADPATVFEIGKEYEFLIIKVDAENIKVTLSYKQIQPQPYQVAAEKYPVGTIITGKVQSLVKFGAFVSIEPGVDGLVHISNISTEKIADPADVLAVGQEVEAKVINFSDNRIGLSIKDVNAPEASEKPARAPKGKKADRPATERKAKKPEDNLMSEEERQNMEAYGNGASASNNAFASMLQGINIPDED